MMDGTGNGHTDKPQQMMTWEQLTIKRMKQYNELVVLIEKFF